MLKIGVRVISNVISISRIRENNMILYMLSYFVHAIVFRTCCRISYMLSYFVHAVVLPCSKQRETDSVSTLNLTANVRPLPLLLIPRFR